MDCGARIFAAIRNPVGVDAADFVDLDFHYAPAFGVGYAIPFARSAHAENHVGAVTVLDDVANDPALFISDDFAGIVQNRDDRNVQTRLWRAVHLLFHKTQKKKLSEPWRRVNVRAPNDGVNSGDGSRPISTSRSRVMSRNSGLF